MTLQTCLVLILFLANTLLYPYARFVYEGVVRYIVGDNIFVFPVLLVLPVKVLMMILCWVFAIFISPVGLIYLYFSSVKSPG
ncbi:membrane protein [Caballeronia glebae]|uniref:Membrane protein n=1 Tax=Caballeronia glebae TaxID=1777143 RepID=A0A157ZAE1_9BURK|nr:membrane protein [Caballeronia glebae]